MLFKRGFYHGDSAYKINVLTDKGLDLLAENAHRQINAYAKSNGKNYPIVYLSHLLAENNAEKIGGSYHCINREVVF